ncbi:MAG TPA: hypothetical protein VFE78_34085 [Gemmataceae bacterium]|jgi:hypothetical protein|nr:hypothetical protein [Gemmataceae bacterium]
MQPSDDQGPGRAGPEKTREERMQELQALARTPGGREATERLFARYRGLLPGECPPVSLLMHQALLDHEYPPAPPGPTCDRPTR